MFGAVVVGFNSNDVVVAGPGLVERRRGEGHGGELRLGSRALIGEGLESDECDGNRGDRDKHEYDREADRNHQLKGI